MSAVLPPQVIVTPGPVRSSLELDLFATLHPCLCGEKITTGLDYTSGRSADGRRLRGLKGECPTCGRVRIFESWQEVPAPPPRPTRADLGAPSDFFLAEVRNPSQVIGPHELLALSLELDLALDPDHLEPKTFHANVHKCSPALRALTELLKFIPDGADTVPDDAYRDGGWPEARAAHPECYTRAWIEDRRARAFALRQRYLANWPRIEALEAAAPRSAPPPRARPFAEAALEAHRIWTLKGGIGLGTRLEVAEQDASGVKVAARPLAGMVADHVTFDRADFSFATLDAAEWTGCSAREAGFGSTSLVGATLVHCHFDRAHLGLTKLGEATVIGCTFDGANLDRSTWYRASVRECSFHGARFGNAAFDNAVFTDCDFRGADFSLLTEELLGTIHDALFERCDLRGTRWAGRTMRRARFVNCRFADIGAPPTSVAYVDLVEPDLSPDATGTPGATREDWCRVLGIDLAKVAAEDQQIRDYWTRRWIADGDDPNAPELEDLFHHPARRERRRG
ncbi:MAG TPA: pentapeptide repeat-containing protein [Kofleriaceae bacterium]|nr:pentapeptide repeat-containing protein [Kofleriaceae bacterium]